MIWNCALLRCRRGPRKNYFWFQVLVDCYMLTQRLLEPTWRTRHHLHVVINVSLQRTDAENLQWNIQDSYDANYKRLTSSFYTVLKRLLKTVCKCITNLQTTKSALLKADLFRYCHEPQFMAKLYKDTSRFDLIDKFSNTYPKPLWYRINLLITQLFTNTLSRFINLE